MDFATIDVAFDVMLTQAPTAKAERQKKRRNHHDKVSNEMMSLLCCLSHIHVMRFL